MKEVEDIIMNVSFEFLEGLFTEKSREFGTLGARQKFVINSLDYDDLEDILVFDIKIMEEEIN